jgi:twitching motility protein PilT
VEDLDSKLDDTFDDFFSDDTLKTSVSDELSEGGSLPMLSLDRLSSGEVKPVILIDSVDDGDRFFEHVPGKSDEPASRIVDDSGDFSTDYSTDLPVEDDEDLLFTSVDDLLNDVASSPVEADREYYSYFEEEEEEDPLQGFELDEVLSDAIDLGASDVHIQPNEHVRFTILGSISLRREYPIPDGTLTQRIQQKILSNVLESNFIENLELDTSYVMKTGRHAGRRLRLSVGKSFGEIFMVMRVINDTVPSPSELGITGELLAWTDLPNGLIMLNGPTGTGKSVTLASLLKRIQLTRNQKIITLERPIEFIFGSEPASLVTQREIGRDARSFKRALDSAMRQAPDIIMVGEVRNREEVNELLRAAETGHLTISTMHTNSAAATINRIKSLYDGADQLRILASLSDVARGFANQVLVKAPDGKSRSAVREVLTVDKEIARLIAVGDVEGIREAQMSREATLEHALVRAVHEGRCTPDTARSQSSYPRLLEELFLRANIS